MSTDIFYAQGVKDNVLFFERKEASEKPRAELAADIIASLENALVEFRGVDEALGFQRD